MKTLFFILLLATSYKSIARPAELNKSKKTMAVDIATLAKEFCNSILGARTTNKKVSETNTIIETFCPPAYIIGYSFHKESKSLVKDSADFCNKTYPIKTEVLENTNRSTQNLLSQMTKAREGCLAGVIKANANK